MRCILLKHAINLIKRTVLFLLLSSLSLLLAAFGDYRGKWWNILAAVGVGAGFWIFLILGYISFYQLSKRRKEQEKGSRSQKDKQRPGIIVFFANPYARAADIAMVISFIATVVFQFVPFSEVVSLGSIAAFVFSAQMHGIFNGVNFQYIYKGEKHNRKRSVE